AELHAGRHLLNVHLNAALAGDAGDGRVRERELHADGRREAEAHRAEATGVDPAPRLVEEIVLRGEHLVLTHVRGDVGVAPGYLIKGPDHPLRFDELTLLVADLQAFAAAPMIDALPPGLQGFLIRLLPGGFDQLDHFLEYW